MVLERGHSHTEMQTTWLLQLQEWLQWRLSGTGSSPTGDMQKASQVQLLARACPSTRATVALHGKGLPIHQGNS